MRTLLLVFAVSITAACGAPPEVAQRLVVEDAWAAPTPGGVDVSAGYLTISNNGGAEDRLLAVSSPRAERVELHETTMDQDVMRMRPVNALVIPAGGEIALAPGGRHLMFYGVSPPFTLDEEIRVQLSFENAGVVEVTLPVRTPAAGHSGH